MQDSNSKTDGVIYGDRNVKVSILVKLKFFYHRVEQARVPSLNQGGCICGIGYIKEWKFRSDQVFSR